MIELFVYYILPNVAMFGGLFYLGKALEKLGFVVIDYALENWDEIQKLMPR